MSNRNSDDNNEEYRFNIILIGDHFVGKSSLVKKFFDDGDEEYIGVVCKSKIMKIVDQENKELNIKLLVYDFNGGYRFLETIATSYYKYPNAFIICYSKDNLNSFKNITNYINEINLRYEPGEKNFIKNKPTIIIAGLKSDIPFAQVDQNEALKYCESLNIPLIHTVSSKENIDTESLFQTAIQEIYKNGSYSLNSVNNSNKSTCSIN